MCTLSLCQSEEQLCCPVNVSSCTSQHFDCTSISHYTCIICTPSIRKAIKYWQRPITIRTWPYVLDQNWAHWSATKKSSQLSIILGWLFDQLVFAIWNVIALFWMFLYIFQLYIYFLGQFDNNNYFVLVFICWGGEIMYLIFFWMLKSSKEFHYRTLPCIEAGFLFPSWDFWTSSQCSTWLSLHFCFNIAAVKYHVAINLT